MLKRWRKLGLRARLAVATAGVAAAAALGLAVPAAANAEYFWGCTYSWGTACIAAPYGYTNYLITMDPDDAISTFGQPVPQNGYKEPKWDGRTRDVCGAVWNQSEGLVVPWNCAWGRDVYTFPGRDGQGMIGTAEPYYKIALYQEVNWTEPEL